MARAIPRLLLPLALLHPGVAFAEEPAPAPAQPPPASAPAPPPTRQLPPPNPFGELGAAGLVGGTFSLGVLIGCAASNINPPSQSQCVLASGLTALGLIAVGVPMVVIGRSRNIALAPRVTFIASARGGVLGVSGSF